jgi:hypothetical protein
MRTWSATATAKHILVLLLGLKRGRESIQLELEGVA